MYQSIDEQIGTAPSENAASDRKWWFVIAVIFGIIILALALWLSWSRSTLPDPGIDPAQEERMTYLSAIATQNMDMRRARLIDFLDTYPDSDRQAAAAAQKSILDAQEAADWSGLTNVMFDLDIEKGIKLASLAAYEARWSPVILGGREDAVATFRAELDTDLDAFPDRNVPIDPSEADPDNTSLVGAPQPSMVSPLNETTLGPNLPVQAFDDAQPVIREAEVVSSRRPRYPRRALNNDVEAVIVLRLMVDATGEVETTELVSASAPRYERDFIRAAERAAMKTRFRPKSVDGRFVASEEEKRYRFEVAD